MKAARGDTPAIVTAFTLIELLVVLAIMGILAALALPSIKGMRQASGMAAASQQLLDDAALARRLAIQNRTTVVMIFIPPMGASGAPALSASEKNILLRGQQTGYALFAFRQVGDQPGQQNARYLKAWNTLPDGYFIPEWKFNTLTPVGVAITNLADGSVSSLFIPGFLQDSVPLPSLTSANPAWVTLPYIAFGPEGRLQKFDAGQGAFIDSGENEIVPLARGSILLERDASGDLVWTAPDVVERPAGNSTNNYNLVVIDHLTGRGRLLRPEIP
jgi:prepilin-type N-terminal cleavage/methylation domain-containing protein